MPGMRVLVSIDERHQIVERYEAQADAFDEYQADRMRATLEAWNRARRGKR